MKKIFIPKRFSSFYPSWAIIPDLTIVSVSGFALQGYEIELSDDLALTCFSGDNSPVLMIPIDGKESSSFEVPHQAYFFAQENVSVICSIDEHSLLSDPEEEIIVESMEQTITVLSALSGQDVHLHVCKPNVVHYPEDDDTIHIVLWGNLPGDSKNMVGKYVNNIRLNPGAQEVKLTGPAFGYGLIVKDKFDHRVAQIVGSTIYLFVPREDDYLHLLGGSGTELFRTLLLCAWEAFVLKEPVSPSKNLAMLEDQFLDYCHLIRNKFAADVEKDLKEINNEIERLNEMLVDLMLKRRLILAKSGGVTELVTVPDDVAKSAWIKLSEHPHVDFLERSKDDCLHVHTKDILVPDESGRVRNLGRFIIRVNRHVRVVVWSKYVTHPKRIQHPHISKFGVVCFGNITNEVNMLLSEGNESELVVLVLSWLVEGYEAVSAETKLEEWPLASEIGLVSVLDLSSTFCALRRSDEQEKSVDEVAQNG